MCSLETLGTIPTSLLVFVENFFTSLQIIEGACLAQSMHCWRHLLIIALFLYAALTKAAKMNVSCKVVAMGILYYLWNMYSS